MDSERSDEILGRLLEEAARDGLMGRTGRPGAVRHSEGFARLVPAASRVADLGSGAGLPGLVLALRVPDSRVVLIESSSRRADHLRRSVVALGLGERVVVEDRPAEELGHDREHRSSFDVVTARSFGPPPWVAECAAGLLRPGGILVVSEPPGSGGERWIGLSGTALPLVIERVVVDEEAGATYAVLTMQGAPPGDLPRRRVAASRRPLFGC